MAFTAAKITGVPDYVSGNKRVHTRRLTFTSNYATGGEAIAGTTALNQSTFGLSKISRVILHNAVAMAADVATGNPVSYNTATGKLVFYESGASGAAAAEKTNAEAYPTGAFIDISAEGSR
jgi:hypothetical protein